MTIHSGTTHTRTEHSEPLAGLNVTMSTGLPAVIAIVGILALGWGAIEWAGALVWGLAGTTLFTLIGLAARAGGLTRLDLLDLLGSTIARPGSRVSRAIGAVAHHVNGALLGAAFAYGCALIGAQPGLASGLAWGAILFVLASILLSSIGAVHPAMRRAEEPDPGLFARNFGPLTPVASLAGHLAYGAVLGAGYAAVPLA